MILRRIKDMLYLNVSQKFNFNRIVLMSSNIKYAMVLILKQILILLILFAVIKTNEKTMNLY